MAELIDTLHGAASLLDGHNVSEILGTSRRGLNSDLDATATGNTVENDGNPNRLGDGFEMAVEAFLAGLVVVGCHKQGCISARFFGSLGQRNGFAGRIRSGACDDKTPFVRGLNGDLDDLEVFLVVECGRFPCCSHGYNARNAACDLLFDELAEGLGVELAVTEWRNERGVCSCECHGVNCYREMVPSKTKSAGPVRRAEAKLPSGFLRKSTRKVSPPRTRT